MTTKTFYVTTPIYYPSGKPHIGSAYTTIAADILARWNKLIGKEVFFLTGTDEHTKKVLRAAEKEGKNPKQYTDEITTAFKGVWEKLNIRYDRFIRTSDSDHKELVTYILNKVYKKGDIYKGNYEGLYCYDCEAYYTEKDCPDKFCPIHKRPLETLKEETYFFKLSKYQKQLLKLYKDNPEFISPEGKRQEIINRVKEGLRDLSISRKNEGWGIELPFDKSQVSYVWYDAIPNYLSGIGILENKKLFKKFWPADIQLMAKDILWFHAVIWPAMLFSLGIEQPKKVFAHGWWLNKDTKIGKSSGNASDLNVLIEKVGSDSIRYFLFRETPFGDDGDFSEKALVDRHNSELADKLGNLISRVSTLAEKLGLQKTEIKSLDSRDLQRKVLEHLDSLEFDKALNEIFAYIDKCNEFVQEKKPWATQDKKVLYELSNAIKDFTILLSPFIPETADKISKVFNFDISIKALKEPLKISKIQKADILFRKIEIVDNSKVEQIIKSISNKHDKTNNPKENINKNKENHTIKDKPQDNKINKSPEGILAMRELIEFENWEKLDFRVALIKNVEDIEGADKLYKLTLNVGELGNKIVCAGLKKHYKKEDLKNKKVLYFSNLKPRLMMGIESHGMILAASNSNHSKVILITPEKDIEPGSKIS